MLTKSIFLVLLAVFSGEAASSDERKAHHFCCTDVDDTRNTGEGCVLLLTQEEINACESEMLTCHESWSKKDGHVTCF